MQGWWAHRVLTIRIDYGRSSEEEAELSFEITREKIAEAILICRENSISENGKMYWETLVTLVST